jgi:hypothetical protein
MRFMRFMRSVRWDVFSVIEGPCKRHAMHCDSKRNETESTCIAWVKIFSVMFHVNSQETATVN